MSEGPCPPRSPTHASDLLLALGTGRGVAHIIAGWAEDGALLLKEAALFQDLSTLAAHKLLGVVGVAQRHQVAAPEGRGEGSESGQGTRASPGEGILHPLEVPGDKVHPSFAREQLGPGHTECEEASI